MCSTTVDSCRSQFTKLWKTAIVQKGEMIRKPTFLVQIVFPKLCWSIWLCRTKPESKSTLPEILLRPRFWCSWLLLTEERAYQCEPPYALSGSELSLTAKNAALLSLICIIIEPDLYIHDLQKFWEGFFKLWWDTHLRLSHGENHLCAHSMMKQTSSHCGVWWWYNQFCIWIWFKLSIILPSCAACHF